MATQDPGRKSGKGEQMPPKATRKSPVCGSSINVDFGIQFTLQGTNTYLVGRGPRRLLIDTGEGKPSWSHLLRDLLSSEKATVHETILTHRHHDHVGGVKDLLKICPDAKVYKNQPEEGQIDIADGRVFRVDGASLRAFHCPGHSTDHMALILDEEGSMFTGDNVLGHGTAVFDDLTTYLSSLEKMHGQFDGRAYPGHGAVIEDGRGRIADYIRHRQQREEEVMQVLKGESTRYAKAAEDGDCSPSAWTPMEIVKIIYRDVPENLHEPAERGLLQVLRKLEEDGKIGRISTYKWQLLGRAAL
ncbi:MAG: Beta-lactamase-like protein 2 [Pleopsidium flavum]|nr:MAG: Beta-lactamase-like protein 2 [Pleopsidium flavum]